jgi:hypothetical protein
MKAQKLLDGPFVGVFSVATVEAMQQAFDTVWSQITHEFDDAVASEDARIQLARAVVEVASRGNENSETLAHLALKMFRANCYPVYPGP